MEFVHLDGGCSVNRLRLLSHKPSANDSNLAGSNDSLRMLDESLRMLAFAPGLKML